MDDFVCSECKMMHSCSEYQNSSTSERAYYDWCRKSERCKEMQKERSSETP